MFGVNLSADKDGNPEVSPDSSNNSHQPTPSSGSKFSMDDMDNMDTSGPTETKKSKQDEFIPPPNPFEEEEPAMPVDTTKEDAKKLKEEGNVFYKKKELDAAIQKYDEVTIFVPPSRRTLSKYTSLGDQHGSSRDYVL